MTPDKCPKCGAAKDADDASTNDSAWHCGSWTYAGKFIQQDKCRIRELTAERDRLRETLEKVTDALESQWLCTFNQAQN